MLKSPASFAPGVLGELACQQEAFNWSEKKWTWTVTFWRSANLSENSRGGLPPPRTPQSPSPRLCLGLATLQPFSSLMAIIPTGPPEPTCGFISGYFQIHSAGGVMRVSGLTKHLQTKENPLWVQRERPASKNVWGFETLEKIA